MRRTVRPLCVLLAASAVTVALAACGGGRGAGAGAPASAAFVPADVPVFVTLSGDFESEQWQTAESLARRFPGAEDALAQLDELQGTVGPEVGIAVLELPVDASSDGGGGEAESPPILLVTKPTDPAKLEAALRESDDRPVWLVDDGWYVVADDQATLDSTVAAAGASPLSQSETFERVLDELPDDAIARVYAGGAGLGEALGQAGQGSPLSGLLGGLGGAGAETAVGLSVVAEPQGARVDGVVVGGEQPAVESFSPSLASLVPADALAYASFRDLRSALESFLETVSAQTPDFDQQLGKVELALGVSLTDDVLPLFEGEQALFVRAGAPIPEVTLVLSPADPARGLATLDKLAGGVPALAELAGDEAPFTTTSTTIAGVPVKQIHVPGQVVTLSYARIGDHLVLTTADKGIADVAAPGASIASAPRYAEAVAAADLPDETAGLVYVDLRGAVELLRSLGGDDTQIPADLGPLNSLLLAGEGGEPLRFTGFVGIS